jgi:hypothetical protein
MRRFSPPAELAGLGAAAVLSAMLFASRLPAGGEFLLPRRGGYALYRAAWALFSTSGGRLAFSSAVLLLLLACAAALALALRRARPGRLPASWSGRAGLLPGPLFAAFLSARLVDHFLDLIQLVWFPYGGLDAREPLAAFAAAALAFVPAAAAARDWVAGRRRRATVLLAALAVLDVSGALFGAANGVGRALPARPEGRTQYVVLTEGENGPSRDVYALPPDVFSGRDDRPELRAFASGPRDARTVPALRALYEDETMRWDPDGLRAALLLGAARGDALAPSLLLARLAAVPPSPQELSALGTLADETRWRVGPLGAAELSRAYAHLGDAEAAARWAAKAGESGGIAPGLLGAAAGGALKPGRVSGTLRAPSPARVALYLRPDPAAPYLLDAAGFVAAAAPDAKGRFSFTGLAAGRYYLAVAFSAGDGPRGEISVSGSRGDLILDARRPSLDLPPLTIKAAR